MAGLKIYDNVVVRPQFPQWEPRPDEAPVPLRLVKETAVKQRGWLLPLMALTACCLVGLAIWGVVCGADLFDSRSPRAQTFTPVTVTYEPPVEAFKQTMVIVPHVQRPTDGLPAKCDLSDGCTGAVLFF